MFSSSITVEKGKKTGSVVHFLSTFTSEEDGNTDSIVVTMVTTVCCERKMSGI